MSKSDKSYEDYDSHPDVNRPRRKHEDENPKQSNNNMHGRHVTDKRRAAPNEKEDLKENAYKGGCLVSRRRRLLPLTPSPPSPRPSEWQGAPTPRWSHVSFSDQGRVASSPSIMEEHERKIVLEFCHLLEKSKQLFNGLRDLPQYGHKQWQTYFGRTFDIYTKLWKFQQLHRGVLDNRYGLKRWQIGEIASKIGQLYYHFYLRTSEPVYLTEAYSFYQAIRGRSYYTRASKEDRCELMIKKLRYYARFIVVCLLLKKMGLVRDLVGELDRQITDYGHSYGPEDQDEWVLVVDQVKDFVHADAIVAVVRNASDATPVVLSHRMCMQTTPPIERSSLMNLNLHEIIIIGSCHDQIKYSELTVDMFRVLQTLEREPRDECRYNGSPRPKGNHPPTSAAPSTRGFFDPGYVRNSPHKFLLYQPSLSQVLVYMASGCQDLPPNGALLLYISADGCFSNVKNPEDSSGYDTGGIVTFAGNNINTREVKKSPNLKEIHCLHPGDLYPFTRKPLFIIVESSNSIAFQHIPRHFGQPITVLMSPMDLPPPFQEQRRYGSLFTLFLHSPLTAFLYCCDILKIPLNHWERCQLYIEKFLVEASRIVTRSRIDAQYIQFMGDDYLRLLLLRYVFCEVVMRTHRAFRTRAHRPRCAPNIPEQEILENPILLKIVFDLASHLEVRTQFHEPAPPPPINAVAGPAPKEKETHK